MREMRHIHFLEDYIEAISEDDNCNEEKDVKTKEKENDNE